MPEMGRYGVDDSTVAWPRNWKCKTGLPLPSRVNCFQRVPSGSLQNWSSKAIVILALLRAPTKATNKELIRKPPMSKGMSRSRQLLDLHMSKQNLAVYFHPTAQARSMVAKFWLVSLYAGSDGLYFLDNLWVTSLAPHAVHCCRAAALALAWFFGQCALVSLPKLAA